MITTYSATTEHVAIVHQCDVFYFNNIF